MDIFKKYETLESETKTFTTYSKEHESESRSVLSNYLRPHGLCSPWNSLGQNIGVGSLSLLQGIFPIQGPRFPTLQVDSLPAEPQGKPFKAGNNG